MHNIIKETKDEVKGLDKMIVERFREVGDLDLSKKNI